MARRRLKPGFARVIRQVEREERVNGLKMALKETGMTRTNFARMIDVDVRTVRRWLSGERRIDGPTAVLLDLLCFETRRIMDLLDAGNIKNGSYQ